MKAEFTDVSETQKTLTIEIPSEVVDAEIDRVAKSYSRQARIPGFRPGKVPAAVVKQRFRDQILHDVLHGLIPRAVEEALTEHGIEPIETPSIKDVALREGQPLRFTADIETVPGFDPGDLSTIEVRRPSTLVTDEAVDRALERLRQRAARYEPVEGRPVANGDTVVVDIERRGADGQVDRHEGVTVELGSPANPPGFDAQLVGLSAGDRKTFTIRFPSDYIVRELAETDVTYTVDVKEVRHKVLPELDDEFAKDLGEFDSLAALRDHVRRRLEAEADEHAARHVRAEVLKQLAARVPFAPPPSLVEREIDRRLEEFARQLVAQHVDPRDAGIDWAQFREAQREPARAAVAGALVLDELARREQITVAAEDVDKEIERIAARAGRTPAAVRAQLEKEGGIARLAVGLRRERAVDLAVSRAKVISE
jgi:trigger factor